MRWSLAPALLLTAGCFNFDNDFNSYCARTGRCDGGVSTGGGDNGGGSAGGSAQGGGTAGGSAGGSAQGGGSGGGAAQGGGGGGGGGGQAMCGAVQCTNPINGVGYCDAGTCDIACNPTFHRCGFSCVDENNPAACGPTCMSCPNVGGSFSVRACDAGVCDWSCAMGFQRCGMQCLQANSAQSCGNACTMCSGPGGSQPFCDAGSCDFICQSGYMKVGATCIAPPVMTFPNIADVTDPNTFIDARLDPTVPGTVWAIDFSGQLLVSTDLAQTPFTVVCRLPGTGLNSTWSGFFQRSTTRITLSRGLDHVAYVTTPANPTSSSPYYGHLYRADMSAGTCKDITPFTGSSYFWSAGNGSSFAAASDGTLYVFDSDSTGSRLHRSADRGTNWVQLDAGTLGTYYAGLLAVGPSSDLLLSVFTGSGSNPQGLYLISDGGTVINRVSAAIYGTDVTPRFSWAQPGEAYSNNGYVSMTGGSSWQQSTAYTASGDWALDPSTNSGYRFTLYDGGANIERASDMHTPAWARVNAFFPAQGAPGIDRLDAVNGQVAALVGGRLFVSGDSGASFRRVGARPPVVGNATLDSLDGTRVFLVSTLGGLAAAYESNDKGLNYTLRYVSGPLGAQFVNGNLIMITRENPQLPNNVIAWARNPSNAGNYDPTTLVTHDGFQTAALGNDQMGGAWGNSFSFAPSSTNTSYFFSNSGSLSTNGGDTYSPFNLVPTLPFVWYPSAAVMGDPTYALVFDCNSAMQAYRVNNLTHTALNDGGISNVLGNDAPCSAEVYLNGPTWRTRVISRAGWLAISDDNGATFTTVTGTGTLTSCSTRYLTSLPSDRNTVFTWCGNRFWVSRNGGQSWSEPTAGPNWQRFNCSLITSLVPTDANVLLTCSDRPPVLVAWP